MAIARALIYALALLLAHEPTGNLHSQNAAHILELLARLREENQIRSFWRLTPADCRALHLLILLRTRGHLLHQPTVVLLYRPSAASVSWATAPGDWQAVRRRGAEHPVLAAGPGAQ